MYMILSSMITRSLGRPASHATMRERLATRDYFTRTPDKEHHMYTHIRLPNVKENRIGWYELLIGVYMYSNLSHTLALSLASLWGVHVRVASTNSIDKGSFGQ